MMQNGRINSPSLDLDCPQAKAEIDNHVHMFRDRGVMSLEATSVFPQRGRDDAAHRR